MKEITLSVSDFRARCLRLIDDVASKGDRIILTRRGRPVAQVVPPEASFRPLRGMWKNSVRIVGDIVQFDTSEDWEESAE